MSSETKKKIMKLGKEYKLPPNLVRKLEYWSGQLQNTQKEEMQHIKSILTPEEFSEYQKELEMRKDFRVKLIGEYDKEEKEIVEKIQKEKVERFLKNYSDKQFHISQDFYDYSMEKLHETFVWSQEHPIAVNFKKENEHMVMQSFLDSEFLIKNGYAKPRQGFGFMLDEPKNGNFKGSYKALINWSSAKLSELESKNKPDERLILFHTHASDINPSKGDKEVSYIMGIIGFEQPNKESKQLAMNSFLSKMGFENNPRWKEVKKSAKELVEEVEKMNLPSYKKKIEIDRIMRFNPDGRVHYVLQPYEFDDALWSRLCSECRPSMGIFTNLAGQEPIKIPLYLNGKLL